MSGKTEWQIRARAAGLSQTTLARLLGLSAVGLSLGIRGRWESGVPQGIRSTIIAWELMSEEQRRQWLRSVIGEE